MVAASPQLGRELPGPPALGWRFGSLPAAEEEEVEGLEVRAPSLVEVRRTWETGWRRAGGKVRRL